MNHTFDYKYLDRFNAHDSEALPYFQNGEIVNELEQVIMDILEMVLGDRFRYCPQVPLEVICRRPENRWLPKEDWQFLVSSKVDITVIERGYRATRKAKLVVECQSHYHDLLETQVRDRKKAKFLSSVGVPLIYVRRIEEDHRFYRFYTPNGQAEVIYNLITQEGRTELAAFLQSLL